MQISSAEDFQLHFKDDIWHSIAETICRRHDLPFRRLKRSEHGEHIVFLADEAFVIKIYAPFRRGFEREKDALDFARGKTSLPLPEILFTGAIENFDYLVLSWLKGVPVNREIWLGLDKHEQIGVVSQLAGGLKELHSHEAQNSDFNWRKFIERQAATVIERQKARGASPEWLARLPGYLAESLSLLPRNSKKTFLHGDVHFGNLRLMKEKGNWRISGLFDFADSLSGFYEYDFVAIGVLMIQGQGELQREFFRAYGYRESEMDENLRRRLMLLTILYECADLRKYALRLKPEAIDFTLDELERAIWNFVV